jgi:hypothetical protein
MPLQIQGTTGGGGVVAEVEANTRALRTALRPLDVGTLGSYRKAMVSGTMAAGLAANSPIFSFRTGVANLYLVRRVMISAGDLAAFTAGFVTFNMFVARGFSASDTGGTAGNLTGNNGKMRSAHATTGIQDFRIASTAALAAGTRAKDADPMATNVLSIAVTAGNPLLLPPNELFRSAPGEQPLILTANEGFVIEATVPATGTWDFGVSVDWDEVLTTQY